MSKAEADSQAPAPRSILATHWHPGHHGATGDAPMTISEARLAVVQVSARKSREADVATALASVTGLALPKPGHTSSARDLMAIWVQPGSWLVTQPWRAEPDLAQILKAACGNAAAIVDQTFGKTTLRVTGGQARRVLAKGCRVDLHPRAFGPGRAVATSLAHVDTILVQADDTPTFDLIVAATFAAPFLEWLEMSAAEFGYIIAD